MIIRSSISSLTCLVHIWHQLSLFQKLKQKPIRKTRKDCYILVSHDFYLFISLVSRRDNNSDSKFPHCHWNFRGSLNPDEASNLISAASSLIRTASKPYQQRIRTTSNLMRSGSNLIRTASNKNSTS